jgi:uncharacterized protein
VKRTVVCISHATGAGGSEIGRLVAERLGFRYVDEEVIAHAAAKGGVDAGALANEERRKSFLERLVEDFSHGTSAEALAMTGFAPPLVNPEASSDELRSLIRDAIEETAARGDAVIVSHAASHAIGGGEHVLRVLVTASPKTRTQRVREAEGLDEPAAERAVKNEDSARSDYLKRFHGIGEEKPTHYDLVLNTDQLSLEQAAELVSTAASA